jgi:hypothetical protein
VKIAERLYRWLLRFYPREFRDEYGDEMSLVFRDRAAGGAVILWLQVIGDLLFHAPQEPVTRHYLTAAHFKLLRDEASSFESVTAINNYRETGADLLRDGRAERVRGLRVSSDYFQALRSPLWRGPGFERRDELGTRRGSVIGAPRAVLSSELWRSAFRGDPSILGSTIQLSGEPFEVVGMTVLRQAGLVLGAGLIAGTFGALVLGRWLTSLTFGISPSDPRIISAAAVVLTMTGLIAAWVPSRRTARVEPKYAMQES